MLHSIFIIYSLINIVSSKTNQCSLVNSKLNKHGIHLNNLQKNLPTLTLCQRSNDRSCCPQIYEAQFRNATAMELHQLFEFYSIQLYEPLRRMAIELNNTIERSIESSRNETHWIFQRRLKSFAPSYRSAIDLFYNHLITLISKKRTYNDDVKISTEELFRSLLRTSIELSIHKQPILPSYLSCLWRNQPFGNIPNVIINQVEVHLRKLLYLNDLFKLSIALVETTSMSVTIDQHCIDSYLQLSYCNLCSGRTESPCLANCVNVMASCLVNISRIHAEWSNFLDATENVAYFSGIEIVLSSIGMSISDALITFLNFDGLHTKDIINQCGHHHQRKELFPNDQSFHDDRNYSSSILDQQLMSMRQSLQIYRSFWLMLPKTICQLNGISATNETVCWTGSSISLDGRHSIRTQYDKPLNLRLQRILKEMKELSELITNKQRISPVINISTTTIDALKLNLTDDLEDYPTDNELDYSDYVYEDSLDDLSSKTTTTTTTLSTTLRSSSFSTYDDILIDDVNTVSYYDYGEQDVYTDDEIDETSTRKAVSISTLSPVTTTVLQIPPHHQRQPIIWNINIDEYFKQPYNSGVSSDYSIVSLLLFLLIFLLL